VVRYDGLAKHVRVDQVPIVPVPVVQVPVVQVPVVPVPVVIHVLVHTSLGTSHPLAS